MSLGPAASLTDAAGTSLGALRRLQRLAEGERTVAKIAENASAAAEQVEQAKRALNEIERPELERVAAVLGVDPSQDDLVAALVEGQPAG